MTSSNAHQGRGKKDSKVKKPFVSDAVLSVSTSARTACFSDTYYDALQYNSYVRMNSFQSSNSFERERLAGSNEKHSCHITKEISFVRGWRSTVRHVLPLFHSLDAIFTFARR